MQQLWLLKIGWDEALPIEIESKWKTFRNQLPKINHISIDRCAINPEGSKEYELHGFADASELAYGAVIYIKTRTKKGNPIVKLVCAKSRVAPLKKVSLPRLELCAALLLASLTKKVISIINIEVKEIYLWTDSTITLQWIKAPSINWKTFVANRVSSIQEKGNYKWHHVPSKRNPADVVSRGLMPEEIVTNLLWWNGPSFLNEMDTWPIQPKLNSADLPEHRINLLITTTSPEKYILNKYSDFAKMINVMAYCRRFISNLKNKGKRNLGILTIDEISESTKAIVKIVQGLEWKDEISHLTNKRPVNKRSTLFNLNVFLDNDGIIRVGGRIRYSNSSYEGKHQIVLPSKHQFTELLIRHEHLKQMHAGPLATLAKIRQRYWPINARNTVRHIIRQCIKCFKANPTHIQQMMGQLPRHRVQPARPFSNCGVDYCGPFYIRQGVLRGTRTTKAYIALFICFATKAIHLELVNDMTTDGFIAALKRFISRRGKCSKIYSDNGTNFIGANSYLKELYKGAKNKQSVTNFCLSEGIQWEFIPPRAPHFGGLWEAGVKSIKYHLKRILGTTILNYVELYTLLTQIEACVNSRPITPISSDVNDLEPLTPGHFLIGDALSAIIEPDLTDLKIGRLSRWQLTQQIFQNFWKRWSVEYLSQLQQMSNKAIETQGISLGALGLIKEDNLPPTQWLMGRIIKLYPGKDNIVRVITVKTKNGILTRPISKFCALPIED